MQDEGRIKKEVPEAGERDRGHDMIRIICDRCGSTITDTGKTGYISLLHRQGPDGPLEGDNEFEQCHFCGTCMEQVGEFIRHSLGDTTEPARDPHAAGEPSPQAGACRGKKGRKVSIDYGKIMALKDAKWSNKDIAEEMGMTPESVAVAVHNYRKKNAGAGEQEG